MLYLNKTNMPDNPNLKELFSIVLQCMYLWGVLLGRGRQHLHTFSSIEVPNYCNRVVHQKKHTNLHKPS